MRFPFRIIKNRPLGTFDTRTYEDSAWYPWGYANEIFGAGSKQLKDFLEVPELNAVINIRARAMASGITDAYSKVTDQPQSSNQSLVRTLRRPNWFQGSQEFWRQSSLWRDIFGNEYIYFLTPVGLPNTFKGMFTLNPSLVTIKYKPEGTYFHNNTDEGVSYTYNFNNKEIPLDKTNLIHLNDNRVQTTNILKGTSKIDSLQASIKNIRAAYQKRNIALHMPIGIISNNAQGDATGATLPMLEPEKKQAKEDLRNREGGLPIFTQMAVKFDGMEVNSQRLGLFEEVREDTGRICDMYGVPYELLASQKGTTFTNLKEARKQMYEETVIPDAGEKDSALNNHIKSEELSWEIRTGFKHLPVFANDMKDSANTNRINMMGVDTVLNMPITNEGKISILMLTYGYSQEAATDIVKPKEAPDVGMGTGENIQVQSLNGAQVTAMVTIVQGVADGSVPRNAAIEILIVSFGLTRAQASAIA